MNPRITMQDVTNNPDLPWKYMWLSQNPSITIQDVLDNPREGLSGWYWHELTNNPSVTLDFILRNPDKKWDWFKV
jgi:hypothetical protein